VRLRLTTSRQRFFVHLLLSAIGSTAVFALVIAAAMFAPLIARMQSGVPSSSEMLVLADRMLTLHARYWPVVFMSLAAVCMTSLLLFERMTAPLVRFLRCFQSITNGELPNPIHIRRGDYLTDEAECLNTMMASLGVFLNDLRDHSDAIMARSPSSSRAVATARANTLACTSPSSSNSTNRYRIPSPDSAARPRGARAPDESAASLEYRRHHTARTDHRPRNHRNACCTRTG
jgi:methyl-accepting chemotaxis protein